MIDTENFFKLQANLVPIGIYQNSELRSYKIHKIDSWDLVQEYVNSQSSKVCTDHERKYVSLRLKKDISHQTNFRN